MKKLVGGLRFFLNILFFFLFYFESLHSSQIYDYQTESFINELNKKIQSVNKYNRDIIFKIISDDYPNAYVDESNTIYLSSGLIVYSTDYVSLLAVLAHEIGHIEKYHISKRRKEINNLNTAKSYGNLAAVLGSMLMERPDLINSILVNKIAINNMFINFSQEQEIEADLYSIDTLNDLNLPLDSVIEFHLILEKNSKYNLIDNELKKFSTHPLVSQRIDIIEYKTKHNFVNYNAQMQEEFNFIQAKFMAYTNKGSLKKLNKDQRIYYEAIKFSTSGKLFESLKKINFLISKYNNFSFLLETKADILLSYGYTKQALEFYKKVLKNEPKNNYAKFNIITNLDIKNINPQNLFFFDYVHLILIFPNNQILISKLYYLAKELNLQEWEIFFQILKLNDKNKNKNLNNIKEITEDNNLKKIINEYLSL
tara:strand:- start:3776 stop:5050 length:1275 start_codon:yes stop_codon:yes gene_type:complete